MKVRTIDELVQILDDDLQWRRRELHDLLGAASASKEHQQSAMCRAALALCYAHFEGFIKNCGTRYLEYISRQGLKYKEIKSNFIAISCHKSIREAAASKKVYLTSQLIDFLIFNEEDKLRLPFEGVVDTESNLNSNLLRDIARNLGISNYFLFDTDINFIDRELLKPRNSIAHGERSHVSILALKQAVERVNLLMSEFKTCVENAACQKKYLCSTPD